MRTQPTKIMPTYLKDYRAPDYGIEQIDLHFELAEEKTIVRSLLQVHRNTRQGRHQRPLILNGENLKLVSLHLNEQALSPHQYEVTANSLTLKEVPDLFTLEIITEIYPHKNTTLSGLYRSQNMFCTQCEAEGFRRMTYYLDRPDVMAPFTTTIVADRKKYPVLLSNGNKVDQGELADGRHWVKWQDPFKKPAYLFALVAGDLTKVADTFTTQSGKKVALELFVEHENKHKCGFALQALKHAMKWDEENYGREYDLDIYMIVAVNDFNMGAMENKGLNIFNAKYILADEQTATDADFQNVEAVVGHEYFHNWTGNRITCRDWFQLSLKEGLTVFREQQFSAAHGSPTVKRISDARMIRTRQFGEDAGPMAHPVQPDSYIEINNFYTATVYYKGAEVIRMLHTILGRERFRKGMDLYFARHDGQAVTIEDFVAAHSDANNVDLNQFMRWYQQAGTPVVKVKEEYNDKSQQYTLYLSQSCPQTPDKKEKKPYYIPIKIAFYDQSGNNIPIKNDFLHNTPEGTYLILDKSEQKFVFNQISSKPVVSLLGDFSAPVKLDYPYLQTELALLMTADNDLFNRWDAAQRFSTNVIKSLMNNYRQKEPLVVPILLIDTYRQLLQQATVDPALMAQLLSLPSFQYIAEELPVIEVDALIAARQALVEQFSRSLQEELAQTYQLCAKQDQGTLDPIHIGYRALKNTCLAYLLRTQDPRWLTLAENQYIQGRNMTDKMGALASLNHAQTPLREKLFEDFYQKWQQDPLVVNKWLALQASSELPNTLDKIKSLLKHKAFDINNPNKVYALINTFSLVNPEIFHANEGQGYDFLADRIIELNQRNPQVAARLLEGLTQWKRLDEHHGTLMKKALIKIQAQGDLSEDVYEIVTKSLV